MRKATHESLKLVLDELNRRYWLEWDRSPEREFWREWWKKLCEREKPETPEENDEE